MLLFTNQLFLQLVSLLLVKVVISSLLLALLLFSLITLGTTLTLKSIAFIESFVLKYFHF